MKYFGTILFDLLLLSSQPRHILMTRESILNEYSLVYLQYSKHEHWGKNLEKWLTCLAAVYVFEHNIYVKTMRVNLF